MVTTACGDVRTTRGALINLRRVGGQIRGVIAMLESGRDCAEIVTQLAAVFRALDHAGLRLIAGELRRCLAVDQPAADRQAQVDRLEELFLSLA